MADSSRLNEQYSEYPIFKGLQRPLEFMGIRGRYIYWAAASVGTALMGFIIGYIVFGFVTGLILLTASLCIGVTLILIKQRKGLHTKDSTIGTFVYSYSKKR